MFKSSDTLSTFVSKMILKIQTRRRRRNMDIFLFGQIFDSPILTNSIPILSFPHVANIGDRARHLFNTNHMHILHFWPVFNRIRQILFLGFFIIIYFFPKTFFKLSPSPHFGHLWKGGMAAPFIRNITHAPYKKESSFVPLILPSSRE